MLTLDLGGQTAVVTGGLQGIGAAIVQRLLEAGAQVVIGDIHCAPGERETAPGRLEIRTDVRSRQDVAALMAAAIRHFGGVDIVVNNSGVSSLAPFEQISDEEWEQVMAVNTKGVYLVAQAAIPALRQRGGGRIINIASQAGKNGYRLMGHYVASKHAVLGLTKVMAIELARDNILVNAVCPGIVETAMKQREREAGGALRGMSADQVLEEDRSQVLLGRTAQPLDVANVVVFLASHWSSYMTGQAINVTGGMTMH